MTDISERLELLIQQTIVNLTRPCGVCERSGVCSTCGGEGQLRRTSIRVDGDGHPRPDEVVVGCDCGDGDQPLGACWYCKGNKDVVPERSSAPVMSAIGIGVIVSLHDMREAEDFVAMNDLLDVAAAWVMRAQSEAIASASPEVLEEIVQMRARTEVAMLAGTTVSEDGPDEGPGRLRSSALTEEDLRELGVVE